jgi:hypothetical protein
LKGPFERAAIDHFATNPSHGVGGSFGCRADPACLPRRGAGRRHRRSGRLSASGQSHPVVLRLPLLQEQAAAYEAADPSRPVKLAYEVIASVAQRDAGADGNYLEYTDPAWIQEYIDYTAANDLLLILDMQYGRNSTEQEIDAVEEYLVYPHVHLALDPEFHVAEGEVPGEDLGQIDAADVDYALQRLAQLSADNGIPPKILIVHQFNVYSIANKDQIQEIDGVQFVLEVDGWGDPEMKQGTYDVIAGEVPFSFYGFKLWYQQDVPLMTPEEVLALVPPPDIVIYQ